MFEYVSPKCRPYRGFLVTTGFVSHGFRRGLRCDVPPGLSATQNWSTTRGRSILKFSNFRVQLTSNEGHLLCKQTRHHLVFGGRAACRSGPDRNWFPFHFPCPRLVLLCGNREHSYSYCSRTLQYAGSLTPPSFLSSTPTDSISLRAGMPSLATARKSCLLFCGSSHSMATVSE